jgi:peptide/nickel transport system substrate-binding protein
MKYYSLRTALVFISILLFGQLSVFATQTKTAFYALHSDPILNWDPSAEFSNGVIVLNNIYETLLRYNPITGKFTSILATHYFSSKDKRIWTFEIRKNVYFHDGALLDADAVKFSIERTMRLQKNVSYIWNAVDSITVVNKYTVRFELSYPAPMDLIVSSGYGAFIMSPKAVNSHLPNWLAKGNEAGTGPYNLTRFKMGDQVVLSAFRYYWRGWKRNQFNQIVFKRISESATRRKLIENGTADITISLSIRDIEVLKNNTQVNVCLDDSFVNLIMFLNTEKSQLKNKIFRQAISLAFPYKKIITEVMNGYATQSSGLIPKGIWGHSNRLKGYQFDIKKAAQLISKSKKGRDRFQLLLTYVAGNEKQQKVAELYQTELKKIGVDMEIRGMSWESQWQLAKNINPENRQDLFMMHWWPDLLSPHSWLYNLYHSQKDIHFNLSYLKSENFDHLIDQANLLSLSNRKKATRLIIQAQQYLLDEAVSIFVYDRKNIGAFQKTFKGFQNNPAYQDVVFFYDTYRDVPK